MPAIEDVTELKKAETVLNKSELKFKTIFDNAADGIIIADVKSKKFYMANNVICRMLGYSSEEIVNLGVMDIHPEKELPYVFGQFEKQAKGELGLSKDMPMKRKDGSVFYCDVNTTPIKIAEKKYLMGFFHDTTERRAADEKLRESERKIRAIFDQTFQFIGMMTLDGTLIEANRTAMQFAGIDESDCLGKPFWDTPWWRHSKELQKKLREAVIKAAGGEIVRFEATHPAADGSIHSIDFSLKPVRDENGKVIFLIPEGRDITDLERMKEYVKTAENEKTAAEIKSRFVSMVSHELRSPLGAIKEGINLVLEGLVGDINNEQKDLLNTAKRNVERLARLVNNVLDFQKIRSGKMEYSIRENDINLVVLEIGKASSILAAEKNLNLVVDTDDSIPIIKFDEDRISQAITNLVNNALKFTREGSVNISTKRRGDEVCVTVKDTGPGIKTEEMPMLFQIFEQLSGTRDQVKGGTGLGLAISKEIIIAHNGKIWAESEEGKGSAFHFTLPIK